MCGQSDYQEAQSHRLALMNQEREKLLNSAQVQEEQIRNLKVMLNSSLSTKLRYENIFKQLLDDDQCRNKAIDLMRQH